MKIIAELDARLREQPDRARDILAGFVQGRSFPIVDESKACFFFWDGHRTDAAYLMHWVFGLESRLPLHRLGQTDAFYLPIELPYSGRVEYKLEIHRDGQRHWVRDPLNPRQAFDPFGSNSVCPMPGYRDPRWVRPETGVREGRIESLGLHSRVWGDQRVLRVYLPNEYKPHKRYPLVVCHDGDDYLRFAGIKHVLDNLIHRHEVKPLVVCFTSGSKHRNVEYGANPRQAEFLLEEVLPTVRERYGVSEDPQETGLMGASFGGVSSLYTAWNHPGVFGRLLLQSGSFVFTDVGTHDRGPLFDPVVDFVNAFREDPGRVDARIFMSCGTFESLIYYNRSLVPLLRRSGLDVRFVESQDGHNWIAWRDRLREGLTWLFRGHLWMTYD